MKLYYLLIFLSILSLSLGIDNDCQNILNTLILSRKSFHKSLSTWVHHNCKINLLANPEYKESLVHQKFKELIYLSETCSTNLRKEECISYLKFIKIPGGDILVSKKEVTAPPVCSEQIDENTRNNLPIVSILTASITKNMYIIHPRDLFLFKINIKSLQETLSCGFKFIQVLGYDIGDKYFDNEINQKIIKDYFYNHITLPLKEKHHIDFTLELVPFENKEKKPGPIFNHIARHAYNNLNSTYFFRINDDTEILTKDWAKSMSQILEKRAPIYGVVGPRCHEGNTEIFTHDFVHRTHMEIFDQYYYPKELTNWWLDDWITHVYGKAYSSFDEKTTVYHSIVYGTRYEVIQSHKLLLDPLLKKGRKKIEEYAKSKNIPYNPDQL